MSCFFFFKCHTDIRSPDRLYKESSTHRITFPCQERSRKRKKNRRKNKQNRLCSIESSLIAPPPKLPHLTLTASTCSDLIAASKQANLVASNYIPLSHSHHTGSIHPTHTYTANSNSQNQKTKHSTQALLLSSLLLLPLLHQAFQSHQKK